MLDADCSITVGRLGAFAFPAGWYVYAGSALGGLRQRVARHRHPSLVRRWHVDYLRAVAPVREALTFPGRERRECALAAAMLTWPGAAVPAPRFGASDCGCSTHLAHFAERPREIDDWRLMGEKMGKCELIPVLVTRHS